MCYEPGAGSCLFHGHGPCFLAACEEDVLAGPYAKVHVMGHAVDSELQYRDVTITKL